ncbi:glycoside hydrolase family 3 N-terminal domain-containing protein [Sphingomonas sp. AR_OL41]|uniref:glycoside hydrolase family 3 N-terminal domain-containing protein n=1 Tax=Sphingomonas sp. AR_OL41 TaxID=3042729 RepID=UPI0024802042|nr:glycoside hydrolase family 3 N-terminal domain-containing protein [Sphingomonas sp. AR_OL41]MDH7972881.1 glycoside hydrolase family 3 N-terminal domain-containing protein [Sphingomonas sp. AR_OL41]
MAGIVSRRELLKGASAIAFVSTALPVLARPAPLPDPFIERLIAKMSVADKAGQLSIYSDPARTDGPAINPGAARQSMETLKAAIAAGRMTGLFNGVGVAAGRALQRTAVEQSPHGIPLIFAGDVIHGMKTTFPVPLGEASSFDPALARRTARAAAVEASARGIHWVFAPMVDVARDQRWGRVVEGAGEDTWLGRQFAAARVRGFQGDDLKAEDSVLACPKHFAGYGAVTGGMEYNSADIPETTLREVHLPPFRAAFDAGALSTMASFNDIAGVPSTGNRYLLTDILRGEWGYKGLVVSDYTSEEEMILHGFAADGPDAVVKALGAGCDISMQSGLYDKHLPALVRAGKISMATLDTAVRRVLHVKQALGLFDNPYRSLDPAREQRDIRLPQAVALAREAACKSIVLLKNEGALLPLAKSARIALIGPCVSDKADMPGPWASFPDIATCVTPEEGFRAAMGPGARLEVVRGSDYEAALDGGIDRAVAAARAAEMVVLVIGESAGMSGEAQARAEITIPEPQRALAEAVAATGKPVIVLLRHGRALALGGAVRAAPAILATWFLGSETGNAMADIVFGDRAPQGRLPVSFPQVSGQEPFFYNHRATGRPQLSEEQAWKARYREVTNAALYPFGHGLGYSAVAYSDTEVSAPILAGTGPIAVSATVTNSGTRQTHEVAQLYIHDKVASLTQPVRALKGVRHLDLAPGQSTRVTFALSRADLAFVHPDRRTFAEPGAFDVWVAPSSVGGVPATFLLA